MKCSARLLLALAVLIGIGAGCGDSTEPILPVTPPVGGPYTIYVADPTGQNPRQLAHGTSPGWSPDGSEIAFNGSGGGISVVDADGSKGRQVASGGMGFPRWSPDGTKIAYVTCIPNDQNGPFPMCDMTFSVINVDGSGERALGRTDFLGTIPPPEWSPDGEKIAFLGGEDDRTDLYVVNMDGSGMTQLTQLGTIRTGANWSPDGRTLAFGAAGSVHVVAADGSDLTRLTNDTDSLVVRSVVFSPAGDRIAYSLSRDPHVWESSNHRGSLQIRVINADGTGGTTVATDAENPRWSPDGRTLSFYRWGDQIWIVSADGGPPSLLLPAGVEAAWSPDGTRLAYVTHR